LGGIALKIGALGSVLADAVSMACHCSKLSGSESHATEYEAADFRLELLRDIAAPAAAAEAPVILTANLSTEKG
jgi:hypothetical protein